MQKWHNKHIHATARRICRLAQINCDIMDLLLHWPCPSTSSAAIETCWVVILTCRSQVVSIRIIHICLQSHAAWTRCLRMRHTSDRNNNVVCITSVTDKKRTTLNSWTFYRGLPCLSRRWRGVWKHSADKSAVFGNEDVDVGGWFTVTDRGKTDSFSRDNDLTMKSVGKDELGGSFFQMGETALQIWCP